MAPTKAIGALGALAAVLVLAGTATARIPEPDNILYGAALADGQALAGGTVSARLGGSTIASAALTPLPGGAAGYVLRLPVDSVDPRAAGTTREGDAVELYVGGQLAGAAIVGPRGAVQAVDLDTCLARAQLWYRDADADGWSDGVTRRACSAPVGFRPAGELAGLAGDCRDADAAVFPGALELCDGRDNDCDGEVDEALCPDLAAVPGSFDFGPVPVGTATGAQAIRLVNRGATQVSLAAPSLTGASAPSFLVVGGSCGATLAPGAACEVRVSFAPKEAGALAVSLLLPAADPLLPALQVALSGSGDPDADGDGIPAGADNCPGVANADQADRDGDGVGDTCDTQPDVAGSDAPGTAPLARTGQAVSAAPGDDGALRAGVAWPEPRFVDNGDGTLTDALTGLVWLRDANCFGTRYPALDPRGRDGKVGWAAALAFVAGMNDGRHGACGAGRDDWRLPNVTELESLVAIGQRPAGATLAAAGFENLLPVYWSSTPARPARGLAWTVAPGTGAVAASGTGKALGVLPVRGATRAPAPLGATGAVASRGAGDDGGQQAGVPWPAPRFVAEGDELLRDGLTGLVWSASAAAPGPEACRPARPRNWAGALAYVRCLNEKAWLGHTDWRLPNRRELRALVNYGAKDPARWLRGQGFAKVRAGAYWTSSSVDGRAGRAWTVDFGSGALGITPKKGRGSAIAVWPVRGGVVQQ